MFETKITLLKTWLKLGFWPCLQVHRLFGVCDQVHDVSCWKVCNQLELLDTSRHIQWAEKVEDQVGDQVSNKCDLMEFCLFTTTWYKCEWMLRLINLGSVLEGWLTKLKFYVPLNTNLLEGQHAHNVTQLPSVSATTNRSFHCTVLQCALITHTAWNNFHLLISLANNEHVRDNTRQQLISQSDINER